MRFSAALLSDLIGLIYDAAIDPGCWPATIEAIRVALGFENAAFALQTLPTGEFLLRVTTNIPDDYAARMPLYGAEVMELLGDPERARSLPLDEPLVLSRINPAGIDYATSANRYTQEWARPQGLVDAMALPLARDEHAVGSLSLGWHGSAGPIVSDPMIEVGRLLLPHLQRATTINRLLDMAELARATFAEVIDTITTPVLLVTRGMRVVHANPAAETLIAERGLLHLSGGFLSCRSAPASAALGIAVEQAINDEAAMGRKGLGIPLWSEAGPMGALHVLPLARDRYVQGAEPVAAIFVSRSDTPFVAPTQLAAALYGLTPAEAKVFEYIATGHTVDETSENLGVQRSTVRTHLLRVFGKTGTGRQVELVQLAASLSVPTRSAMA